MPLGEGTLGSGTLGSPAPLVIAVFDAVERYEAMLDDLPPFLRADPDVQAVIRAYAYEAARLDAYIEFVRRQLFPQTVSELLMGAWEALVRTTAPFGATVEVRRVRVLAALRRLSAEPSGSAWENAMSEFIAVGWTYREHDPADVTSPPAYTVRIEVPFAPGSSEFEATRAFARLITPAHLALNVVFSGGFVLGESHLGTEAL